MCINLANVHHSILNSAYTIVASVYTIATNLNSVGFKLNCWLIWNQTFVAPVVDVSSSALKGTSQRH